MNASDFPRPGDRLAFFGRVSTPRQKVVQQWSLVERWLVTHDLTIPDAGRFMDSIRRHEAARLFKDWTKRKTTPARKKYQFDDLMRQVESGQLDWVIIASFDRWGISDKDEPFIFRSKLKEYDVQLFSVQDDLNITAADDGTFWRVAAAAMGATRYVETLAENNIRKMVHMAEQGWATTGNVPYGTDLVCYPLDNMNRPLFRVERLEFRPAKYRITTYDPESRVERDENGFITSATLKVLREEISGNMPPRDKKTTGYRYEPGEERRLQAVRQMFDLYDSGVEKFARIIESLWDQGFAHYTKRFGYHGVEEILRNPVYIGRPAFAKKGVGYYRRCVGKIAAKVERKRNDTLVRKNAESEWVFPLKPVFAPIVPEAQFKSVQQKLDARPHVNESFGKRRTRDRATHPLNGVLHCPDCRAPMVLGSFCPGKKTMAKTQGKAKRHRCFHCGTWRKTNRTQCNANTVRWALLDRATEELLRTVADRIGAVQSGGSDLLKKETWLQHSELGRIIQRVVGESSAVGGNFAQRHPDLAGHQAITDALWAGGVGDVVQRAVQAYEERFEARVAPLRDELTRVTAELNDLALELPRQRRNPTVYERMNARIGELERRKAEIDPQTVPLTAKARDILARLDGIRQTIEAADQAGVARLLDTFLARVEPIFDVKAVGQAKRRRAEVIGFRFIPKEEGKEVLQEPMEIGVSRTGTGSWRRRARSSPETSSTRRPARW